MPLICYQPKQFNAAKLQTIATANAIIADYRAQGYDLTLRQLYYQFVARDIIPNHQKEYDRLGATINDGRLAGLIDWEAIVDRTRNLAKNNSWGRPSGILKAAISNYHIDMWDNQPEYVEVWVEKDALKGVVAKACNQLDVPYFSCRGYTSQSEMWVASQRLLNRIEAGKNIRIIHLGDHDPSGIDMSRDIQDRLEMFTYGKVRLDRVALNFDQVQQYQPPPNPAKSTDSRYASYLEKYGDESWELDALEPSVITDIIEQTVVTTIDRVKWEEAKTLEERGRNTLQMMHDNFPEVVQFLRDKRKASNVVVCRQCGATALDPACYCEGGQNRGIQLP